MTGLNNFVDLYVAVWNEPDDDRRRALIAELYSRDAVYVMYAKDPFVGREAIWRQITYAYRLYAPMGFTFTSSHNATGHHNLLKFNWIMVSVETGELEIIGFDVLVLDAMGRISADYQFHDKLPSFTYDDLPTPDDLVPL